jgi:diaminopimelate epimerase
MRFTKVNGLGNDYCVFDSADALEWTNEQWGALARLVSDRKSGVGSDGILVIGPGEAHQECVTAASMHVFNADGSHGEMCGNGLRCVGRLLVEQGRARAGGSQGFVIATGSGLRNLWIDMRIPEQVRTTLGHARYGPNAVGAVFDHPNDADPESWRIGDETARLVSVGNPHAIVIVEESLEPVGLAGRGAALENAAVFPDRINAQFARIIERGAVSVQSWERGAGGNERLRHRRRRRGRRAAPCGPGRSRGGCGAAGRRLADRDGARWDGHPDWPGGDRV